MSERADPARRPPDPAGTQPKVDPRSLDLGGQATFLPAPIGLPPGAPPVELEPTPSDEHEPSPLEPAPPDGQEPRPSGALEPKAPDALEPAAAASARAQSHTPRFQFLLGALGALGVCAIGVFALLLSAPKAAAPAPWSAWRPSNNGIDPAQQIAEHVAPAYQLDSGKQIVRVTGGPPTTEDGQPLTPAVLSSGQRATPLEGSVLYRLCGGGTDCSIKAGKPSVQRGLLLSREALELALYTFRYVGGVNQVLVTMPPPPPSPAAAKVTNHALMFRAQDFEAQLGLPLDETLSPLTPRVSQMDRSSDAPLVGQLTGTRLYDYVIDEEHSEDGQTGWVLVLSPPTS